MAIIAPFCKAPKLSYRWVSNHNCATAPLNVGTMISMTIDKGTRTTNSCLYPCPRGKGRETTNCPGCHRVQRVSPLLMEWLEGQLTVTSELLSIRPLICDMGHCCRPWRCSWDDWYKVPAACKSKESPTGSDAAIGTSGLTQGAKTIFSFMDLI